VCDYCCAGIIKCEKQEDRKEHTILGRGHKPARTSDDDDDDDDV